MNQVFILYLVSLLMDMCVAGVTFAISRRAAELGATASELGLLGAVWFGAYTVVTLITGRVSDRIGRRQVATTGCLVAATITVICAYVTDVNLLLALTVVFGVGIACFWPAVIAWLGERVSGAKLATRLTIFSVAWNIGLLLGFAVTGLLFKQNPRLSFFVAAALMVLIAFLLMLPMAESDGRDATWQIDVPHGVPKGRGFRKTAWLANFAVNFSLGGTVALFPQLATTLGIGADLHGELLALSRGAAVAAFLVLEVLVFWRTRVWPLWIAQMTCAAAILSVAVTSEMWMFALALVVAGAVSGFTYQASLFFTLEEMTEKGKGSGLHEAYIGSGMFLGPLLAGWVGSHQGLRSPYFFCAAVLVLCIVLQMATVAWRRKLRPL